MNISDSIADPPKDKINNILEQGNSDFFREVRLLDLPEPKKQHLQIDFLLRIAHQILLCFLSISRYFPPLG